MSSFILGFIVGGTFGMMLMSVLIISNKGEYSNEELANKTNEIR